MNRVAHGGLDSAAPDVLAQRLVDEGLVVTAAHLVDPLAEAIQNFVVETAFQ